MNDLKLNGGILIVGSLFWDQDELRESWRSSCLLFDRQKAVAVPIRYGRISRERHFTYTMVFSSECKTKECLGTGKVVPFADNPVTTTLLNKHARALIKAEQKKDPDRKIYN